MTMEIFKVFLFSAFCITTISSTISQRTYRRACDCEYTVDGKCAYTLLLPKGQETCSQGGSTSSGGGDSPNQQQTNNDVMNRISALQTNVSQLWTASGDQARMLNQLQSMFISQQENMYAMTQNMTMMLNMMAENMTAEMMNAMNGWLPCCRKRFKLAFCSISFGGAVRCHRFPRQLLPLHPR